MAYNKQKQGVDMSKIISKIVVGAVAFLAVLMFFGSYTVVSPGNVGVIFNQYTGSIKVAPQGMAWKVPFVTTVQVYPVSLRTYTMVKKSGEGSSEGDDSLDLPTKEGQHIRQDLSVTFNTSPDKAADVFKAFKGADIEDIESTFVRRTIITVAQNAAGQMSLTEVISSQRDQLQKTIQTNLAIELSKMGFNVDKINMGASHLPQAIEQQMQQKMAAQQQAQQSEYEFQKQQTLAKARKAEAEGTAQAILVTAQAQAQANKLLQASLTPMLIENKKIERWNGALPMVTGGNTPFINLSK